MNLLKMDNSELQETLADVLESAVSLHIEVIALARSGSALRLALRELHPIQFENVYLKHFAEPGEKFQQMRDSVLAKTAVLEKAILRLREAEA